MEIDANRLSEANLCGGIYLIVGDDEYLTHKAETFFRELLPKDSLALRIVQDPTDPGEIFACAGNWGFDAEFSVTIARGGNMALTASEHRRMLEFLRALPKSDWLAFSGANYLDAAEKKLMTKISCARPDAFECREITSRMFENGIEGAALRELCARLDFRLAEIERAKEKLVAYSDGAKTDAEAVKSLVTEDAEAQAFAFIDNMLGGDGDRAKALKQLEKLKTSGYQPGTLISMLETQATRMLLCKTSKLGDAELAQAMRIKPYAVKKMRERAPKAGKLKNMLYLLNDCEYDMKSGAMSDKAALNVAIARLAASE